MNCVAEYLLQLRNWRTAFIWRHLYIMQNPFVFKWIARVRVCILAPKPSVLWPFLAAFPSLLKIRKLMNWCQSYHKSSSAFKMWSGCHVFLLPSRDRTVYQWDAVESSRRRRRQWRSWCPKGCQSRITQRRIRYNWDFKPPQTNNFTQRKPISQHPRR